ncbi:zinc transporter, ZIP family [Desulfonispora thiosulfatigenes DSM 11270]|uniref:Zinc transporter, ZIP family n=1 Tax=Desulfonispora thiosulfatigenes DSM 11270 TaxID=656914 RepID=A0A1W1VD42_DESTI|nr:ZIP family metal transporter [Desulfonispora thiosulfatigenes]SMB91357.1 zinc transporter, ZIP family [Desulfonispora thiosulfatigenes DSM 11270]
MNSIIFNGFVAGIATLIGSFFVLALGTPSHKFFSFMLGLATGVMLTVTIVDLVPSAYYVSNLTITLTGFLLGLLLLALLDKLITNFPPIKRIINKKEGYFLKMGYLIAIGIALHDLPEGIAIAVGYSATDNLGLIIVLAIGIHNIPEGMATTVPLKIAGMKNRNILLIIFLISLVTPLGAYLGLVLVSISPKLIGLLLALAGGAMTFIVSSELWPEASKYNLAFSYFGAILGILIIIASTILI